MSSGAEIEELLRRTDPELVSLLLDLGHAYREGANVIEFFTKHNARINAMHLRDIRGKEQVPLGQGDVNYAGLGAAVREAGWRGWLTVEQENLPKTLEPAAIEAIVKSDRDAIHKFFGV
jgi:inosose dehydratase